MYCCICVWVADTCRPKFEKPIIYTYRHTDIYIYIYIYILIIYIYICYLYTSMRRNTLMHCDISGCMLMLRRVDTHVCMYVTYLSTEIRTFASSSGNPLKQANSHTHTHMCVYILPSSMRSGPPHPCLEHH